MTRYRIVHIITSLDTGGVRQEALYAASHLNRTLFDIFLIAGPGSVFDDEAGALPDVTVRFCGEMSRQIRPAADYESYKKLREILQEWNPDIVHTHGFKAGVVGRLAASSQKVPLIVHTYHGFGFHKYQSPGVFRLSTALEKEACRRTQDLIFVSYENKKWAEELDLIQKCSTTVIRSGVEVDRFLSARRSENFWAEFGITPKEKVVGMIASLKLQKDPLTFLEAAELVAKKKGNVKFLLIGDGDMAGIVMERAARAMLPERFIHLGFRRDIPEVLANLDLVVLPSLLEGLPRVLVEATITGVPVIASNVDGNREIVMEGRNGILAEARNPQDFAEKILRALKENWTVDPDFSRQIQHEYDIRETLRRQEEVYLKFFNTPRN